MTDIAAIVAEIGGWHRVAASDSIEAFHKDETVWVHFIYDEYGPFPITVEVTSMISGIPTHFVSRLAEARLGKPSEVIGTAEDQSSCYWDMGWDAIEQVLDFMKAI